MTKKQKQQYAQMSRESVEELLRQMCEAQIRVDAANAQLNAELVAARARYEADLAADGMTINEIAAMLHAWADGNAELFEEKKSLPMVHGTLKFQTGQPALKPVTGSTWEKALALVKRHLPDFVRKKEEIDREAVLAARKELGAEKLKLVGLMVDQAERFHYELNLESIPKG